MKTDIGERIRSLRGELSQQEFADALGFSRAYVSDIERGKTKPSLEVLSAIAAKYRVSIDWIITGRDILEAGLPRKPLTPDEEAFRRILDALWEMYKGADDEIKGWLRVQLKRAVPELAEVSDTPSEPVQE